MSDQIPAIPQGKDVAALTTALNDRIRRINTALTGAPPATAGKPILYGTHAERVSRPTPADSTLFIETDRNDLVYLAEGTVWWFISGTYRLTQAQMLALAPKLGAADIGLLVYTIDTLLTFRWNGSAFIRQDNYQPVLADTHANRLANFPSTRYVAGQEFFESDRTVRYVVQPASGTVNTAGTAVTWVSGNHFVNTGSGFSTAQWPAGTPIVINGVSYLIASVTSPTAAILASSAGIQAAVPYSVVSGRWVYSYGTMQQVWANMPTDLGENDVADSGGGFIFLELTNFHVWQWTASLAWNWGPGDRHSGEIAMFDAAPGAGWHLADGTAGLTKYAFDGTRTTAFTVPDMRGAYLQSAAAPYTGLIVAAVAPVISGSTAATTHSHTLSAANAPVSAVAATATAAKVVTAGAGTNVADQLHTHPAPTISGSTDVENAHVHGKGTLVVDITGTPATFAILTYYRL